MWVIHEAMLDNTFSLEKLFSLNLNFWKSLVPFIKEDGMMHDARSVGQQVGSRGVEATRTAMKENRHDQQDSVISELRELPSYLEAQRNLYQAHEILLLKINQLELDTLVQHVSNVYQDQAKMKNSMEKIIGMYVEYLRETKGLNTKSSKFATPQDILDHYTPCKCSEFLIVI